MNTATKILSAPALAAFLVSYGYFFAGWQQYNDYRSIYTVAAGDL